MEPNPYNRAAAITPSDATDLAVPCDAVYVGGAGNIAYVNGDGTAVTLTGALVGTIYPIRARRINATNTTATNLVALYVR